MEKIPAKAGEKRRALDQLTTNKRIQKSGNESSILYEFLSELRSTTTGKALEPEEVEGIKAFYYSYVAHSCIEDSNAQKEIDVVDFGDDAADDKAVYDSIVYQRYETVWKNAEIPIKVIMKRVFDAASKKIQKAFSV